MDGQSTWVHNDNLAPFTDLYELTMLQAYWQEGMHQEEAVFSLFVRRMPPQRNYLIACGLDDVLTYFETARFTAEQISYLDGLNLFSDGFLDWLGEFRFTGDVYAVAEGTPIFDNEPILEVLAPVGQAQLAETFVMNQIHVQTLMASKAARVVTAADGRGVVDFGTRRMHGTDAAIKAARAFYIAGVDATSNVLAGELYGIPVSGTMAHSFIQACDDELGAFRSFARLYPETTLLVDTYDTMEGVRNVIVLARELGNDFKVHAIRLDSGDLAALAKESRALLDEAGLYSVEIFASSSLDEYVIAELVEQGTPINGFGVGTKMGVSEDAPSLDFVYKLTSFAGEGRIKLSPNKAVLPGRKQVFRTTNDGIAVSDVVARFNEKLPGTPLLEPVMQDGKRLPRANKQIGEIRIHARSMIGQLPRDVVALAPVRRPYSVEVSDVLQADFERVRNSLG